MTNTPWHTLSEREVLRRIQSAPEGLSREEAARRLAENGPNVLTGGKQKTWLMIFLSQFGDFMIWILIAAAVISALIGETVDAAIIAVVVALNAILGTVQESRAEQALAALQKMAAPSARALRDGHVEKVPADSLVLGDMILLEAGESIPADLFLVESASLRVEESALTGESVPAEKASGTLSDPKCPLGDRVNMAFMGTSVSYGRGRGLVIAAGMSTEMGRIAGTLAATEKELTPLQKKLSGISNLLSVGVLGVAVLVFLLGLLGQLGDVLEMFLTAVSLAVAAIPEGMVAVVTIVLAMGMSRMAGRGAIIRRLPAVETLGSTQIICSDKTGTLTQNRMTVMEVWTDRRPLLFDAMLHCNDAALDAAGQTAGDPTETALIDYLLAQKKTAPEDVRARRRAGEIPFDSGRKLSTVAVTRPEGGLRIFVKGAPDVLSARCVSVLTADGVHPFDKARRLAADRAGEEMAVRALRVLAFAYKDCAAADFERPDGVEEGLVFLGLTGMIDPARPEAREAIALCRRAGIQPIMITGDHKVTAVAIARDLGILGPSDGKSPDKRYAVTGTELDEMGEETFLRELPNIGVYARVAPEHKSLIVSAWQKRGKVVAMTGDGVNDAPALRAADIGVGMGITGTDVSKGASDMVLTDDNFATIVLAVGEGRRIFDNIHKTVRFLLSSNAGEVLAILAATMVRWVLLRPAHILWINLVTDTFPALALGVEPAEPDIMDRKPRDGKQPFFTGRTWLRVLLVGLMEAALTLGAYLIGCRTEMMDKLGYFDIAQVRALIDQGREVAAQGLSTVNLFTGQLGTTMAFLTLSLAQLFAAVGFQSERFSVFRMKPREHKMLFVAFFGSAFLQVIVVLLPPLRVLFGLTPLSLLNWAAVIALCFIMLAFVEIQKAIARKRKE
ncbi:MAG: cation-translocating P-type ATPase [Oscillospiraceae bacterium]|jgi:Ca2+-transporting ATPase|nr:cation-translocating P-type ATPase [Oscillospiraceae bacterium]